MKTDQRKVKGEETKNRILNATMHLISKGGLKSVSANKIAERAGISKSSIFHHFASIDEIPYALLSTLCDMMTRGIKIDEVRDIQSFFDVVGKGTFDIKGEELVYYRTLYTFYNEAVYSGKYQEQINQLKMDFMTFLQNTIEELEGIRIPIELAELITIDLDGLGLHYLMEEEHEKYKALWALKTEVYIQYINRMK